MAKHPDTAPECHACSRPTQDAYLCAACAYQLDEAIAQIVEYQGLAYDLDVTLSQQDRIVRGGSRRPVRNGTEQDGTEQDGTLPPGTLHPSPIPYNGRASDAAAELNRVLRAWAAVIATETNPARYGPTCQACGHDSCRSIRHPEPEQLPASLPGLAAWLRSRVGWLRHHVHAAQAHGQIIDAVRTARAAVDRPAERLYAGPCDECGEDLYARLGALIVECVGCEGRYEVEARRAWLLASAEDVLATGVEISRAVSTYLGQTVTPSALRGHVLRGSLVVRGERAEGGRRVALYRLGDVLEILARQAAREAQAS